MEEDHDLLLRRYYGNNGTRLVVLTYYRDGVPGWEQVAGGPFDWGNCSTATLRLAHALLANMGASPYMCMRYGQKLMLQLLSKLDHNSRLAIDEIMILTNLGCRAVDDLCEVK